MVDLKAFVEEAESLVQKHRPDAAMCAHVEIWNHHRGEYGISFKVWDENEFFEGPTPGDVIALMRERYEQAKTTLAELEDVTLPESRKEIEKQEA